MFYFFSLEYINSDIFTRAIGLFLYKTNIIGGIHIYIMYNLHLRV